jgi:solute carrier family 38 (sodium-coupled neutral amino acid transporter), member 11
MDPERLGSAHQERDHASDSDEAQSLLSVSNEDDIVRIEHPSKGKDAPPRIKIPGIHRHSSFAQPRPDGAPRTPNRVRFNIDGPSVVSDGGENGQPTWVEEEDYMEADEAAEQQSPSEGLRIPLLTDIEAPSVTVALEFDPEDHLENAKPRSNLRNAFMNMANSIM